MRDLEDKGKAGAKTTWRVGKTRTSAANRGGAGRVGKSNTCEGSGGSRYDGTE